MEVKLGEETEIDGEKIVALQWLDIDDIVGYRKKKSRSKSKKIRHRDDSSSSFSDDECTSLSLDSSSSSEGEYRSKRARSRSRSEVKGGKKRSRRRYSSEDSSDDSLPVKKRKRSKKSKNVKKNKKKKSSKRDSYVSSANSDSGSSSTCKDQDDSSGEMGSRGRSRGRSREKRKGRRDSTTGRVGKRKNKSEARRSVSPSSSYGSERNENVTMENNPVRLKSVITVANVEKEEEDDNMKNDELKEEIVYDYDDYPSSKSNDSVELGDRVNSSPDKGSVVKEVNSGANLGGDKEKEGNVSGNIGSEVDDLESILRQKALENLSRFRGGIKTKPVVAIDDKPKSNQSDVKQPTDGTVSTTPVSQTATDRSRFTWRRDPSAATGKDEKAASYSESHSSGPRPAELKLQKSRVDNKSVNEKPMVDNKFVNEKSIVDNKFVNEKSMVDTNNADQKSTAVVETSSASKKEGSSKEQQNESNDNSQFEKKTMSVMRGGEMVQVSYKVYIPNKAPALARRQLKR
ncbi:hypothetical protein M8C21_008130 [Ambrosia artemisiifolia]|uniref:Uncharacterized protein n=1 Tax=Ambrosia artemisiifolia TaxID=4212 RepID=A0AAD5BX00_AMBAR|nr:hypothetical protein M8C21_008130 [Ambrosia artemisiifolia]